MELRVLRAAKTFLNDFNPGTALVGLNSDAPFPATNWKAVQAAGAGTEESRLDALNSLLAAYLPALRNYLVVQFRIDEHHANDFLQSFVLEKIISRGILAQADQERGRFRIFLVNALSRFVISEFRKVAAEKRRPSAGALPLENVSEAELQELAVHSHHLLDLTFARNIFSQVAARMRNECIASNRPELWGLFEACLLQPLQEGKPRLSTEELRLKWGYRSAKDLANALTTAKRMFARHFRSVVSQYVSDRGELESEIRDIKNILMLS